MPTQTRTFQMSSSTNVVWGAVFGATNIYPKAMPDQYSVIRVTSGDGTTAGSIREIRYGRDISCMVGMATEQIIKVDHANRTLESRFNNDGQFVGKFFRSASLVIKVAPISTDDGPDSPGFEITWTLTYTSDFNGSFNLDSYLNAIGKGFRALDNYLANPLST